MNSRECVFLACKEHFAVFFCHTKLSWLRLSQHSVKLSVPFYCKALSSQHPLKCHQLSEANWVMCAKRNSELIKLICRHTEAKSEQPLIQISASPGYGFLLWRRRSLIIPAGNAALFSIVKLML